MPAPLIEHVPTSVSEVLPSLQQVSIGRANPQVGVGGAVGSITQSGTIADGDTVTVGSNSVNQPDVVFEFDNNGAVTGTNTPVALGADPGEAIGFLAAAINAANMGVIATVRGRQGPFYAEATVVDLRQVVPGAFSGTLSETGAALAAAAWDGGHDEHVGTFELVEGATMELFGLIVNESKTSTLVVSLRESATNNVEGFDGATDLTVRVNGADVTTVSVPPLARAVFLLPKSATRAKYLRFVATPNDGTGQGRISLCHWSGRLLQRPYVSNYVEDIT